MDFEGGGKNDQVLELMQDMMQPIIAQLMRSILGRSLVKGEIASYAGLWKT